MMESKIRKHEVKMAPSMMSNALVNVAKLPTLRAAFVLMIYLVGGLVSLARWLALFLLFVFVLEQL